MRSAFILIILLLSLSAHSQNISQKLDLAIQKLALDSQVKHGIISLYVVESKSGKVVLDRNAEIGLAPASCQKVVTSVAAFDLLGKDYAYKTQLVYDGTIEKNILKGSIYIIGSGDPTLGSPRYASTKEEIVLKKFNRAISGTGIKKIAGEIRADDSWGPQIIPDGWIWQDIGNYYGAGASQINWRDNQYDIILKSGKTVGDPVTVVSIMPFDHKFSFINELKSAEKGSGDNAYIYLPPKSASGFLTGTIPVNEDKFIIAGAMPDPAAQLVKSLFNRAFPTQINSAVTQSGNRTVFYTHISPTLDSINYWFLKKSINLYGEALVKTIGLLKANAPVTDSGVNIIRNFWSSKGIERSSLKIIDGSGLSPGNRVTTKALVSIMQYAKKQSWFSSFLYDLPELNGIKMKDGYINGVRSYTGYIKSKNGMEYTFSFIINNFDGSVIKIREKMWNVLDILKNENAKL